MANNTQDSGSTGRIEITNKMVTIHTIFVLTVCILFGALNIATGGAAVGIGIIIAGGGAVGVTLIIRSNPKYGNITRGVILSTVQLLLIIVASILRHELHGMFPLMLGSMAIAAVYFNKNNMLLQWVLIDVSSIGGFLFKEACYGDTAVDFLFKGILGMNVCAAIIMYLVKCCLSHVEKAVAAKNEANSLIVQVQQQVERAEVLSKSQLSVVEKISVISKEVNVSSGKMLSVSDELRASAEEQSDAIEKISVDISSIVEQTEDSLDKSTLASQMAAKSSELLNESNQEIENMDKAMAKIEEASNKIQTIVKTIEDISFQTNILALNASVEAARAGQAGKGFAVVADEVRTLAQKSSDSVKNTAALIDASIAAVKEGKEISINITKKMQGVIEASEESAKQSELISNLTKKQTESLITIREHMELISQTVSRTTTASAQSAEIAELVAEDAQQMDQIVKDFKIKK